MSILVWLVLGLTAGFVASKIIDKTSEGLVSDLVLGVVGAVDGGFVFSLFGMSGVTGLNLYSIIGAIICAIIVLYVYHQFIAQRTARAV